MAKKQSPAKKSLLTIVLFVGIIYVVIGMIAKLSDNKETPRSGVTVTPKPIAEIKPITQASTRKGWVTYTNNTFGYEVDVPSSSLLLQEDIDSYTRIQNYSPANDTPGLAAGEYYLEIFTNDSTSKDAYSCRNELNNAVTATFGDVTGHKGSMNVGGDSAPVVYALCVEKDSTNFNITVSENLSKYSREIVNSFRFIN